MFDPYHKWLGIPPKDQPPTHYRLLGIEAFESDADVIDAAANRQMAYIQSCASGPHLAFSQKLLNEIAAARVCLLDAKKRAAYDGGLKSQLEVKEERRKEDRRTEERRTEQVPVAVEQRTGDERRKTERRRREPSEAFAGLASEAKALHPSDQAIVSVPLKTRRGSFGAWVAILVVGLVVTCSILGGFFLMANLSQPTNRSPTPTASSPTTPKATKPAPTTTKRDTKK